MPVIVTEHRFPIYESSEGNLYYPYATEVHGKPPLKRNRRSTLAGHDWLDEIAGAL